MRKIYYLLFIFILTGCSKKSEVSPPANTTITYSFSANISGSYSVYYVLPNSTFDQVVDFTGKTWSKTYTLDNISSYPNGDVFPLSMGSVISVAGETYTLTISINNQVKSTNSFSVPFINDSITYNYVITH
jgi:hypothetical protein